jgi:Multiubiquitin
MTAIETAEEESRRRLPVPIIIDRRPYEAPDNPMTGTQLRQLAKPIIGADRNLYLEKHGTDDVLISDSQEVELHPGMVFFSVPKKINEG